MKKSILIADDDSDIVDLLTLRCRQMGFAVDSATNATTALGKIEQDAPDMVILDVDMPHGNGLSVREMMAGHEELRSIPVIILTASTEEDTVRRCHDLCSYYVLKCPDVWSRVKPVLCELFADHLSPTDDCEYSEDNFRAKSEFEPEANENDRAPALMDSVFALLGAEEGDFIKETSQAVKRTDSPWVLSIEDDDDFAWALKMRLEEYGVQVIRAAAGMEGYRRAFLNAPRAIILDYELPEGNGDYVLRRLKESPATRDIPVITLTGRREASIERQMRSLGASEFLRKPFDWDCLRTALEVHLDDVEQITETRGQLCAIG